MAEELKRVTLSADDVASLKKIMNYRIDKPQNCKLCKHSKEVTGVIDRSWDTICNRPTAIGLPGFNVEPQAVCNHYEPRS